MRRDALALLLDPNPMQVGGPLLYAIEFGGVGAESQSMSRGPGTGTVHSSHDRSKRLRGWSCLSSVRLGVVPGPSRCFAALLQQTHVPG
jgi:hypothetical protein